MNTRDTGAPTLGAPSTAALIPFDEVVDLIWFYGHHTAANYPSSTNPSSLNNLSCAINNSIDHHQLYYSNALAGTHEIPKLDKPRLLAHSATWLRDVFNTFDEDKDGKVSKEELRSSLQKLGIEATDESILSLLSYSPSKEQGFVSSDDFLLLYEASCTLTSDLNYTENNHDSSTSCSLVDGHDDDDLWEAFNIFDKNKDGFISPAELQSVLYCLGFTKARELDACIEMIKGFDENDDGQIDFGEFKTMLNSAIKH